MGENLSVLGSGAGRNNFQCWIRDQDLAETIRYVEGLICIATCKAPFAAGPGGKVGSDRSLLQELSESFQVKKLAGQIKTVKQCFFL